MPQCTCAKTYYASVAVSASAPRHYGGTCYMCYCYKLDFLLISFQKKRGNSVMNNKIEMKVLNTSSNTELIVCTHAI